VFILLADGGVAAIAQIREELSTLQRKLIDEEKEDQQIVCVKTTKPLPRILPLLLSPYLTWPSCLKMMLTNFDLSPVMCFEQPLSRYHCCMLSINFPYKVKFQVQRFGPLLNVGPFDLHSSLGTPKSSGIHLIMPIETKYFLIYRI